MNSKTVWVLKYVLYLKKIINNKNISKMKNLILVLIILFGTTLNSSAQIQKGAMLIGGNVSFNIQERNEEFRTYSFTLEDDYYKRTFLSARPQFGVFINESMLLGIGINYEFNETKSKFIDLTSYEESESTQKSNLIFFNPYFKKFFKIKEKFFLTTSLNFLIGFGKRKMESEGYYGNDYKRELKIFEYRLNISPGLTYFLNDKWALNANIGQLYYSHKKETPDKDIGVSEKPKNISKDYGLSFKFNTFSIGIQYYLGNNSK